MKWLFRLVGAVFGLAATAYFIVAVHRTLTRYDVGPLLAGRTPAALAIAALTCACVIPITSWAWGRLLRDTGARVPLLQLNMILGLTQIAKYLPGNVGQHLGRSAMSLRRGVAPGPVVVTLVAEMILLCAAAVTVGIAALAISAPETSSHLSLQWPTLSLAALLLAVTLSALATAVRHLPGLVRRFAPGLATEAGVATPGLPALTAAFGAYVLNFLVVGVGLYGIAVATGAGPVSELPLFIGTFAVSWVAGFVVPAAPAGLGVREGVMVAILTPSLEPASALKIVVAFRIATTLGDLLALMWGVSIFLTQAERSRGESRQAPR